MTSNGALYEAARRHVSFGDIFRSDFFFDAYLKDDAIRLARGSGAGGSVAYVPANGHVSREDMILAHGTPGFAVLLSDDCLIETAFATARDGRRPSGRLLFCAVRPCSDDEIKRLDDHPTFGRFPLPVEEPLWSATATAELRRCFMVDSRVVDHDHRLCSLAPVHRARLEVRWNAYATRRGPLAAFDGGRKLEDLLARVRTPRPENGAAAMAVVQALSTAWSIEGEQLDRVAAAAESHSGESEAIETLADALAQLASQASEAVTAIRAIVDNPGPAPSTSSD
jgi:hypothetical protein